MSKGSASRTHDVCADDMNIVCKYRYCFFSSENVSFLVGLLTHFPSKEFYKLGC